MYLFEVFFLKFEILTGSSNQKVEYENTISKHSLQARSPVDHSLSYFMLFCHFHKIKTKVLALLFNDFWQLLFSKNWLYFCRLTTKLCDILLQNPLSVFIGVQKSIEFHLTTSKFQQPSPHYPWLIIIFNHL